jgi:hypothetical protein
MTPPLDGDAPKPEEDDAPRFLEGDLPKDFSSSLCLNGECSGLKPDDEEAPRLELLDEREDGLIDSANSS